MHDLLQRKLLSPAAPRFGALNRKKGGPLRGILAASGGTWAAIQLLAAPRDTLAADNFQRPLLRPGPIKTNQVGPSKILEPNKTIPTPKQPATAVGAPPNYYILTESQFRQLLTNSAHSTLQAKTTAGVRTHDEAQSVAGRMKWPLVGAAAVLLSIVARKGLFPNEMSFQIYRPLLIPERGLVLKVSSAVELPATQVFRHYLPFLGPLTEFFSPEMRAFRIAETHSLLAGTFSVVAANDGELVMGDRIKAMAGIHVFWREDVRQYLAEARVRFFSLVERYEGKKIEYDSVGEAHLPILHQSFDASAEWRAGLHRRHLKSRVVVDPLEEVVNLLAEPYQYFAMAANFADKKDRLSNFYRAVRKFEFAASVSDLEPKTSTDMVLGDFPKLRARVRDAAQLFSPMNRLPKEHSLYFLATIVLDLACGNESALGKRPSEILASGVGCYEKLSKRFYESSMNLAERLTLAKQLRLFETVFEALEESGKRVSLEVGALPAYARINRENAAAFKTSWQAKDGFWARAVKWFGWTIPHPADGHFFFRAECDPIPKPVHPTAGCNAPEQSAGLPVPPYLGSEDFVPVPNFEQAFPYLTSQLPQSPKNPTEFKLI